MKSCKGLGEELATALPLRLEELLPGLPHLGVCSGGCNWGGKGVGRKSLANLRASEGSLDRINATPPEWYRICQVLFKRGIIEPIPLQSVIRRGALYSAQPSLSRSGGRLVQASVE